MVCYGLGGLGAYLTSQRTHGLVAEETLKPMEIPRNTEGSRWQAWDSASD